MTNTTQIVSAEAQETLNGVLIDMLKGVKTASGEIYDASRTGITKAVDFAMEQAPLVVQEFLKWKMAEAIISLIFWVIVGIGIYLSYRVCKKQIKLNNLDEFSYIIPGIAAFFYCFLLLIGSSGGGRHGDFGPVANIKTIVKVNVAPRVYLIEYVSDTIKKQ